MGSNKDRLNFEKQLTVIGQSDFRCVFCNQKAYDFYSENMGIEHVENHLQCRNDLTYMRIAHNECNKRFKDAQKPFDVQKVVAENKAFVLTEQKRRMIIQLLIENSPKFAEYMTEKAGKAIGIKVSGSKCLDKYNYELKIEITDKIRQDNELNEIARIEKMLSELKAKRAESIEKAL